MCRKLFLVALATCFSSCSLISGLDNLVFDSPADGAPDSAPVPDATPDIDAGEELDTGRPDASRDSDPPRLDISIFPADAGRDADSAPTEDAWIDPDSGDEPDVGVDSDGSPPVDAFVDPDTGIEPDAAMETDTGPVIDAFVDPDAGPSDAGPESDTFVDPDTGPVDSGPFDGGPTCTGTGCCDGTRELFVYGEFMRMCTSDTPVTQCSAESVCGVGWHLCTPIEYRMRGGESIVPAMDAWMAGCLIDTSGVRTDGDPMYSMDMPPEPLPPNPVTPLPTATNRSCGGSCVHGPSGPQVIVGTRNTGGNIMESDIPTAPIASVIYGRTEMLGNGYFTWMAYQDPASPEYAALCCL